MVREKPMTKTLETLSEALISLEKDKNGQTNEKGGELRETGSIMYLTPVEIKVFLQEQW